jgi:hypothetical protein
VSVTLSYPGLEPKYDSMQMSSSGINVIKFQQKQDKGKFEEKMVRMQKHILVELST